MTIKDNSLLLQAPFKEMGRTYYSKLGLQYIDGNMDSYFVGSLDAMDRGRLISKFGDRIPELEARLDELHLSDSEGVPMHSVENGWYHINNMGDRYGQFTVETTMRHLRVSMEEALMVVTIPTKAAYAKYCEGCKPRWKAEADEVIRLIKQIQVDNLLNVMAP